MRLVWIDDDIEQVAQKFDREVAAALEDDLTELEEQIADFDRTKHVRKRMNTVWRNFIEERYLTPGGRSFRAIYIITGHGTVFYDVIKKRKEKQHALFRSLEENHEQVIKDAELKIVEVTEGLAEYTD
ncbi:hypothetical protein [Natronorubrum sp. A-ect3]|uniref:hypothetical protein n=1 Tax=Natronorubrum sp. A-ect3 TaxID=3242698 RepID=UPI00359CF810